MPGCGEIASVPKLAIVVSVLCTTPRAVLVSSKGSVLSMCRQRCTRWMPLSIPIPSNAGSTRTFAKLKGRSKITPKAASSAAESASGASAISVSESRRHSANRSSAIASEAPSSASRNDFTTTRADSTVVTAIPVACGSASTAESANCCSALSSLPRSCLG